MLLEDLTGVRDYASPKALAGYLAEHCHYWLNETDQRPMWRGLSKDAPAGNSYRISNYQERATTLYGPRSIGVYFNTLISKATNKPLNEVANRFNSRYATFMKSDSRDFGTPTIIIPIGPFTTTHSSLLRDWNMGAVSKLSTLGVARIFDMDEIRSMNASEEWRQICDEREAYGGPFSERTWEDMLIHCVSPEGTLPIRNSPYVQQIIESIRFDQPMESHNNEVLIKSKSVIYMGQDLYNQVLKYL